METFEKEERSQISPSTLAKTGVNRSPILNNAETADDDKGFGNREPEDNLLERETAEIVCESRLDETNESDGAHVGNIVMSPADFSDIVETPGKRWKSGRNGAESLRVAAAYRSSQEENIQLSTSSGLPHDSDVGAPPMSLSHVDKESSKKVADLLGQPPVDESKDQEDEIDHKSMTDVRDETRASDDPDAEIVSKIRRRKSMFLSDDILKKESLEPYKIDIPLRKKVNKSTKKKLWREIERRKPFITRNVIEHISTYAKPPFITWGCRNCEYPYESEA